MQIQLKKNHGRYAKYKHTGKPWMGDMPEEWNILPLKRVVSTKITDGPHTTPEFADEGVPFISVEAINSDGSIDFTHRRGNIESSLHKEYCVKCKPQKNDILLVKSGSTTGKTALVKVDFDFSIWSPLAMIRANKKMMDFQFLYFYLQSFIFQSQVQLFWTFGTQPNIGMGSIEKLNVLFPLIDEQKVISKYLDEKTALIEKIVEAKQKQIELLKEKRSAVINKAVTQGINEGVEMKNSGIEWIGKVPKNWRIERLKRLGKSIIGLTYSPEDVCDENGTLVLRSSNVQNGEIVFDDNVFVSKKISTKLQTKVGDILICSRNGSRALIGKNACIDVGSSGLTFGAFMTIFRSKHWRFLSYVFKSSLFNGQSESFLTSTINQLTIDNLNNMVVVLPDTDAEQEKIVEYLEFETRKITFALKRIERSIALLQEYKTSLVSTVVTGKVKVI